MKKLLLILCFATSMFCCMLLLAEYFMVVFPIIVLSAGTSNGSYALDEVFRVMFDIRGCHNYKLYLIALPIALVAASFGALLYRNIESNNR